MQKTLNHNNMAKYEIKNGVGIIPEGTKEIVDYGFDGCADLIEVTIVTHT